MRALNLLMLVTIVVLLLGGALACSGTKATPAPAAAAPTAQPPAAPTQAPVVPPPAPQPTVPPPPPALPSATPVRVPAVQPTTAPPPAPAAPTQPPVAVVPPTAVPPTAQPAPAARAMNWEGITPGLFSTAHAIMVREINFKRGHAEGFYRVQGSADKLLFGPNAAGQGVNRDGWHAGDASLQEALDEVYNLIKSDLNNAALKGLEAWMQLECGDTQVDAARQAGYEVRNVGTAAQPNWFVRVTTERPPAAFISCRDQAGKGPLTSAPSNPAPAATLDPTCKVGNGVAVKTGEGVAPGTLVVVRAVYWADPRKILVWSGRTSVPLTAGGGILGSQTALDIWRCYPDEADAEEAAASELQNLRLNGLGGYAPNRWKEITRIMSFADIKTVGQ